jgi:hypothetical protein
MDYSALSPLAYSRGRSIHDNRPERHKVADFGALVAVLDADRAPTKENAAYVCGPFNGDGRRCAEGAEPVSFLVVDLDRIAPEVLPDLRLWFAQFSGCAWPTHSSKPDAPRERVIIELARPATRDECIAVGRTLTADLRDEFGDALQVDPATFKPEQPAFVPPTGAALARFEGEPLDVDRYVRAAPAPAQAASGTANVAEDADLIAAIADGSRYHESLTSLAARYVARGMAADDVVAALRGLMDSHKPTGDLERWATRRGEIPRIVGSAARKFTRPMKPEENDKADDLLAHAFWIRDAKVNTSLPYVLKGVFGKGHIVVFWGAPGAGKSFVTLEMSCAVASGAPWRGRRTRRGVVIYIAAESSRAYIENRVAALRKEAPNLGDAEVVVFPLALDLLHAERGDVDRVIEAAKRIAADRGEIVLIVVDTLAVTFGGGNENAPDDMGAYVRNILRIRTETGAAILIVHHCGKDEARGMRGHTALLGALDAELTIEGANDSQRILRTGKVRDGDGYVDLFAFRLLAVDLGVDDDGDPVRSCVVDAADAAATAQARRKRNKAGLGKNQKAVLAALEHAGGRMTRIDLAEKLKTEGMARQRCNEALAALLESGMVIARNVAPAPAEVCLV